MHCRGRLGTLTGNVLIAKSDWKRHSLFMKTKSLPASKRQEPVRKSVTKGVFETFYQEFAHKGANSTVNAAEYIRKLRSR